MGIPIKCNPLTKNLVQHYERELAGESTKMTDFFICYNSKYMNYGFLSNKAHCSMSPRNCPHEVSEVVTLRTGKRKQIYYCTMDAKKVMEERTSNINHEAHEIQPHQKMSCKLNGT